MIEEQQVAEQGTGVRRARDEDTMSNWGSSWEEAGEISWLVRLKGRFLSLELSLIVCLSLWVIPNRNSCFFKR